MTQLAEMTEVADSLTPETRGPLSPRERILHWVAQSRFEFDELDAYEFVLPEPVHVALEGHHVQVDGLLVSAAESNIVDVVILLFRPRISPQRARDDATALLQLKTATAILRLLATESKGLASILRRAKVPTVDERIRLSVVLVTPLSALPRNALGSSELIDTEVLDKRGLETLHNSITTPGPVAGNYAVEGSRGEIIETSAGEHRVVIAVIAAKEVLRWPEIPSRRLFDLNVRVALGMNRVRRSLDEAFSTADGQENILAYHNGLTVLTNNLTVRDSTIHLDGISVVNGAQTVLALEQNKEAISSALRLLVKFVEVGNEALDDAQEIAVRSNQQNPVTTRNLRALDATQIRLRRELATHGFDYETRPDRGSRSSRATLQNDVVAQWLCAIYLEEPWLAVKRTSLFLPENYLRVFPPQIRADRVVFVAGLRSALESQKANFDESYHRAWSLSAIAGCYVAGQLMRTTPELTHLLLASTVSEQREPRAEELVASVVSSVAHTFNERQAKEPSNNYYVEFKSKQELLRLASDAVSHWLAEGELQ